MFSLSENICLFFPSSTTYEWPSSSISLGLWTYRIYCF
jgi:hypothetical protein